MGLHSVSPWSLILILAIAMLLFGTQRVKHIGRDLASAIREFKEGMSEQPTDKNQDKPE